MNAPRPDSKILSTFATGGLATRLGDAAATLLRRPMRQNFAGTTRGCLDMATNWPSLARDPMAVIGSGHAVSSRTCRARAEVSYAHSMDGRCITTRGT